VKRKSTGTILILKDRKKKVGEKERKKGKSNEQG
jgi:hypothetical protein